MTKLRVSYWVDNDDRSSGNNTNTITVDVPSQTILYSSESSCAIDYNRALLLLVEHKIKMWQKQMLNPVSVVHIHKIYAQ